MEQQSNNSKKPQFFAFAKDSSDRNTLKEFAKSHQWDEGCVMDGDISTAAQYFKAHPSPLLLLVEVPSAEAAPALLDELANVCDPDTKVIIIGAINEYSFYCWLTDIGVFSYILRPLTKENLEKNYQRSIEQGKPSATSQKEPTKIFSVIGARGGVGSSAIALNLAGIFAQHSGKKVALVDADPQEGTLSLTLDIEPMRGLKDALEKPERIDPLFIDRVMSKPHDNLCLLSAEENLRDAINVGIETAEAMIRELSSKYDIVVFDIPRKLTAFTRELIRKSNNVVMVAELSLQSLRDTLRISDLMHDTLKTQPPLVVVNRAGVAGKHEMSIADFEKGITAKVVEKILYTPDIFMPIGHEIASISHAKHASMKPLYSLAKQLLPDMVLEDASKDKKSFGFMGKKK